MGKQNLDFFENISCGNVLVKPNIDFVFSIKSHRNNLVRLFSYELKYVTEEAKSQHIDD